MEYTTKEQQTVVESRIISGYQVIGKSVSLLNGLASFVLVKGKHTISVNSLGYDEHTPNRTYKFN